MRLLWFSADHRSRRFGFFASLIAAYRLGLWVRCYGDRTREPRSPDPPRERHPDDAPTCSGCKCPR